MPNSNESSESEFSNENQQNIINRNISSNSNNSNHSGNNSNNSTNINLLRNNNNNNNNSKTINRDTTTNIRHQNYSKNIYIGTRNAEKWDNLRTNLLFKNDVEFVSYLLSLAEKEQQKNGLPIKPDKLPSNFIKHPETLLQPASGKKSKKVQFLEETNGMEPQQSSPDHQHHQIQQQQQITKRSTSSSSSPSSSNRSKTKLYDNSLIIRIKNNNTNNKVISKTSNSNKNSNNGITNNDTIKLMIHNSTTDHSDDEEVLDCRIEEKIKSEILEQKYKNDNINLIINKDVFHETSSNLIIDEKYDDNDDIEGNNSLPLQDLDDVHSEQDNNNLIRHDPSVNDMMDNNNDADDEENDNDDEKILCLAMKNLKENLNTSTHNLLPQHSNVEHKINKKRKKKLSVKLNDPKQKKIIDKTIKLNINSTNNNNNTKKLGHDIRKAPVDGARILNNDIDLDTGGLQSDDTRYMFNHQENLADHQSHIKEDTEHDEYEFRSCDDEANLDLENGKMHLIKNFNGKVCRECNTKHNKYECQIRNPLGAVKDSINLVDWMEKNKDVLESEEKQQNSCNIVKNNSQIKSEELEEDDIDDDGDDGIEDDSIETSSNLSNCDFNQLQNSNTNIINNENNNTTVVIPNSSLQNDMKLASKIPSYSEASLPEQFELRLLTDDFGIFTKIVLPKFTQLGPVIGEPIQEIDISDDCNMKFILETYDGDKSNFLSLENKNKSNWLRYIRPASSRELRNTTMTVKDNCIYFVTCIDIEVGCELLYWSDENNSAWDKKKIDRINCGGCNLKFDHPLFYRTHCSVFHDPAFSLTIRKYHCKVCGIAVLGKENIMKHAAQMHEGKGAYQCQYCKKFFLRLNYLEMHRTYGCSANPQRARPLCDFCGRKFCQPQKLKVHIKRMHSDMAEVLRDFQCKLCSKLLGSRAALQRHSKEVHSRNSTVVSCPRCQKLFQNRSNLKIHMLTHSGVRPFRCAESECSAAFTTKQCLQFHYKKVHGYTQEQMPKIERSVAYTFDAYSGGMKIDVNAEQKSRRRRRSIDYENSLLNAETDDNDDTSYSTQNTKDNNASNEIMKHHASISEICKNETNLSLLSTTISSFLSQEINRNQLRDGESDQSEEEQNGDSLHSNSQMDKDTHRNQNFDIIKSNDDQQHHLSSPPNHHAPPHPHLLSQHHHQPQMETTAQQQNAQLSLVESFLSETSSRLHLETNDELSMMSSSSNNNLDNAKTPDYRIPETINKVQEYSNSNNSHQNLIVSKGSKKWINTDISETNDMSVNRDFLSKLIMSSSHHDDNDDDDNSTILDVVETNQNNQYHSPSLMGTPESIHQLQHHITTPPHSIQHQHHLHHLNHQSNLVSGFYNNNRQIGSISTSASMLVEAALNSVSNIIDSEPDSCQLKTNNSTNNHNDDDNLSNMNVDIDATTGSNTNNNNDHMNHVDFSSDRTSYHHQNSFIQSPIGNGMVMKDNNNDIDVDSVSTPNESFQNHGTPSPRAISPGQDYPIMYSSNHPNIMSNCRRGSYSSLLQDNHLGNQGHQSPQSLPRYDFNNLGRRKRDDQLSSDDENSIIVAQNLSVNSHHNDDKMKLPHSQIEIMYSKYSNDNLQGGLGHDDSINDINETRLKYNNGGNNNNNSGNSSNNNHNTDQGMDIAEFRSNSSNETISDFQGVDMSSRSILGTYHNSSATSNFQIPSSGGVNLSLNRYHHHIYDILQQDREPTSQNEQHNQMSSLQQQQQQQTMHNLMQEDQTDQSATVDLSRSANYVVSSPPPPPLPYSHPHSEMLRMVSLDLTPSGSSSTMLVGGNSHLRHSSSILSSHQINHNSRDSLSVVEHNRLISSEQLSSNHRLLVDPTAHLLMEQNNRIISENRILDQTSRLLVDPTANRHMVSSRGFGAYHHQVTPTNYHHTTRSGLASPHSTNPSNYHPFSAYY